jgi:hypothetical protein
MTLVSPQTGRDGSDLHGVETNNWQLHSRIGIVGPPIPLFQFARRQCLKIARLASDPSATPEAPSRATRYQRITAFAMLAALVCTGTTSCTRTQIALSAAAMATVVVGTTVGVTYAIEHHRHTLQGCAFSGPSGLELRTSDPKTYALEGHVTTIKVGDRVKLHGSKLKKSKDSTSDQVFVVEKLNKDYGSCPAILAASTTPTR